jgi:hypothetical protein
LKKDSQNEELQSKFKSERNATTILINKTKNKYYYDCFEKCKRCPKEMWNLINTLSKNKNKSNCASPNLSTPNGIITDTKEICEYFNYFFATIGPKLANKIPAKYHGGSSTNSKTPTIHSDCLLADLLPCSEEEVSNIINNLDQNCSSGIDQISTKSIKCIKRFIVPKLTQCINFCLANGTFPDALKVAKVTPIYKSGNRSDPGNYRPVSVLPVMSKIFEKIIYNRLNNYLTQFNFLYDRQYGFRSQSSTLSATIDLVTKIKLNIDAKNICLGIFIDLKKAFDTVCHPILLEKLRNIGVTDNAHKIFESYLSNRVQIVKINDIVSSPQPITCGVPQGSIIGPLLFLTYINDISELRLNGEVSLFADDTSIFYFGSTVDEIQKKAQEDLNTLHSWFQRNLLTINVSKTSYIIFKARNKKINHDISLSINDIQIKQSTEEKYLGLILDNELTWKPHIEKIKSKLSSLRGCLFNTVQCLPRQVRYTIYNSLAKSHLNYLIEIWGSATKTALKQLQITQNKLIKTLFQYEYLTASRIIYSETKIMNLGQLYFNNTCILINKIINKKIHSRLSFKTKAEHGIRPLRSANDLCLKSMRTKSGKKNICFEGAQFYNKLPKSVKDCKSFNKFKSKLREYVISNV